MLTREQKQSLYEDLYKNGVCTCKAAGRWSWKKYHGIDFYMCLNCNRPKYYTPRPSK